MSKITANFRLTGKQAEDLKSIAEKENRSINKQIAHIVKQFLDKFSGHK